MKRPSGIPDDLFATLQGGASAGEPRPGAAGNSGRGRTLQRSSGSYSSGGESSSSASSASSPLPTAARRTEDRASPAAAAGATAAVASPAAAAAAAAAAVTPRSFLRTPHDQSSRALGRSPSASSSAGKTGGSDASWSSSRGGGSAVLSAFATESARRRGSLGGGSRGSGSRLSVGSGFSVGSSSPGALNGSSHIALKAAAEGDEAAVLAFLDAGGDVNTKSKNGASTPLTRAAAKGHLGVVKLLLERGAAVNIPGRGGLTALHEAAGCGQDKNGQRPDAMAVDHESRALLRDARCAVREYAVGDNVIASLRRELENLEAEVEGAKAKVKEEASRRVELEIELETLRARMEELQKQASTSSRVDGSQSPKVPRVRAPDFFQE
ncbi:Ankyrin [Ectocarpus siliculosus]|uniref:Ankyrin n=1 Tax=Ectocarpus siliculosus TaxID=2880 RepID=D7G3S8_ECTSI|nr:Ankyrin [Ectocarpus siliculosus]|eukprot:CBJ33605.1 Ankyrin [Ectocarpus siliculosus]